jgi:glutamate synthase domain-containing protein 1
VIHNGEISSYGINRRYLENFNYFCSLRTDTEVITYLFDLLMRKHKLPLEITACILAPPFWTQIGRRSREEQKLIAALRMVYGGALLNGPFSILVGGPDGMIGLNDRTKLRPMAAARKDDMVYIASEEAAIRSVCPSPDSLWRAEAGKPLTGKLREKPHANKKMACPARI